MFIHCDSVLSVRLPADMVKRYHPNKFIGALDHLYAFLVGKSNNPGVYESLAILATRMQEHGLKDVYLPATADTFIFCHVAGIAAMVNDDKGTDLQCHAFDLDQVSNLEVNKNQWLLDLEIRVTEQERLDWQEKAKFSA